MLSDAHIHLHGYAPEEVQTVLQRAREKDVELVVALGVDMASSQEVDDLAQAHPMVWSAVGIHPWWLTEVTPEVYQQLKALAQGEKVRFIGEIGLDLNRNAEAFDLQKQCFQEQIRLAREVGLPLNIHCRGAHSEMLELLRRVELPPKVGLLHGYNGDVDTMRSLVEMGFYLSLGRSALQPDQGMQAVIREVPLERLVLETDSTPDSYREQGYEPASVAQVAQRVAQIRGIDVGHLQAEATKNLKKLMNME